jgi:EAL domain-containing protein (putative c-di-GMP-specific phosphodiesterase class I)
LQISQGNLVGEVSDLLQEYQLDASRLELEITESGIVENPIAAADVMKTLNIMGVQLSIDDFGTGYSSLSQLFRFPFDILKIDRLFINQLCDQEDSSLIFVEAIIQLAKKLGMRVVAEGIETDEQFRKLQEMGCDIGQGFLFSRPLSCDNATKLLERSCAMT